MFSHRNPHTPRLVLLAFLVVVSMAAAFYTWRSHDALEGFEEEEAQEVLADSGSDYAKRMYVMKLFDALLKRKASADELDHFSKLGGDTDILNAIIALVKRSGSTDPDHKTGAIVQETADPVSAVVSVPPDPVDSTSNKKALIQHLQDIADKVSKAHVLIHAM